MRRFTLLIALALMTLACGGKGQAENKEKRQVNLYIWTNYLPDEVVAGFEKRTGIHVNVDTYASNEAVLDKVQSGVADYDVVVPSDYAMKILLSQKLLHPIDHARLPHFQNLDPRFLNQKYDPGNGFSIPYLWGTTGLGFARKLGTIDSWQAVFEPKNGGRILMLDDMREAFGAALRLLGHSINERDPAVLKKAADMLKAQKRLVRTYNSADFANLLATGDVDLAQGFNGELAKVVAKEPARLGYVVPKEGGTLWIDNLAVPKSSRHVDEAYALIDYLAEPEVAAAIVNGVHYASANREALGKIDPKITGDPAIYPPKAILDRCELIEDLGQTTQVLDQLWTEVKAQ
jgi:spermidine/putrescine-binding protein